MTTIDDHEGTPPAVVIRCMWCPDMTHPEPDNHPAGAEHIVRVCVTCGRWIQRVTRGGPWRHLAPATHSAVPAPIEPAATPEPDDAPAELRFRCPHCPDEAHPEPANHYGGDPRHYTRFCATCGAPVLQWRLDGRWHHSGAPAPGHGPHVATLRPLNWTGEQCTTCALPVQRNSGGVWFHLAGSQDHAAVVIAAPVQPSGLVSPEVFAADVLDLADVRAAMAAGALDPDDFSWGRFPRERVAVRTPAPARGDAVEAWIKRARDGFETRVDGVLQGRNAIAFDALDDLLDDYRAHADTGTPLDREPVNPVTGLPLGYQPRPPSMDRPATDRELIEIGESLARLGPIEDDLAAVDEPPAVPSQVEDVTDEPYQWRDQTVRLDDVERWLMRTRDGFVIDNDDPVLDSWNEGAYDSLDILIDVLRDHDGVPPADAEVPTGPPACGRSLGRTTNRCLRPPGHSGQCDDDPPTDPLDARVLPAVLHDVFEIDGDAVSAAAGRKVVEALRLAGFAVTRTGARPAPATPSADAVVSLALDGDRVRLTNEGTGTVWAHVGRQRAMLQHADSIGIAVPVPTSPAPAAEPERVKPADDLLAEERARVLSVALDAAGPAGSFVDAAPVVDALDEQGWTVVPYLTARRFAAVRVDRLAAQVAARMKGLFERAYDSEIGFDTYMPLAGQRTADLIEQAARGALAECGELIDPGSAISLEVPEVPSARSTALAEAVRTAVGEAVTVITGGASANGGGSSPTPPAASAQPTRDRDHDDKPHEHDHPFGNPGGHHHHSHTHAPDPTPPTGPGWYEFDQRKGWRLLFPLVAPACASPASEENPR